MSPRTAPSPSRTVVTVAFAPLGQHGDYAVDPAEVPVSPGTVVIVEGIRGLALGRVTSEPRRGQKQGGGRVRKVLRVAKPSDLQRQKKAEEREFDAYSLGLNLIRKEQLDWKLIRVTADGIAQKMTFCIAAPDRQDVRAFAKELGRGLKMRVEVRQIGVRDVAKVTGGLGRCGRETCCSTFLTEYPKSTIRMAKDQYLALSPDKATGQCDRTLCCLAYEHQDYKDRGQWLPKMGKRVRTLSGLEGKVVAINALRLSFTLLDSKRNRHVVPASDWEGNRDRAVPPPDAGNPSGPPAPSKGQQALGQSAPGEGHGTSRGPRERSSGPSRRGRKGRTGSKEDKKR
ncbi:MAG: regulatory iron-sulfur-containing complex subunit RicT [Myxococcota bacterium]|nr:regulatory iron-sulfur-containing complex subunit RicT [Myxococcota bacterium]